MYVLEIEHFTKTYDLLSEKFKAVDDLCMTIGPGEAVAFIGQNGAGKSTTMRTIAGLSRLDEGAIRICGVDIEKDPVEARKNFGYVSQDLQLPVDLTGAEFLGLIAKIRGLDENEATKQCDAMFELCDLQNYRNMLIRDYSGGMARKIAMAAAFIGTPKLVILDESFVGLDPESTYKIGRYLKKYVEAGRAILISSHTLDLLHQLCTRFFFLHHGQCIGDQTLDKIDETCQAQGIDLTTLYLQKTGQDNLIAIHE